MELKGCATGIHAKFRALSLADGLAGYLKDVVKYIWRQMTGL